MYHFYNIFIDDALGFAILDLSTVANTDRFEGWLPLKGSDRMKKQIQFEQDLLTMNKYSQQKPLTVYVYIILYIYLFLCLCSVSQQPDLLIKHIDGCLTIDYCTQTLSKQTTYTKY